MPRRSAGWWLVVLLPWATTISARFVEEVDLAGTVLCIESDYLLTEPTAPWLRWLPKGLDDSHGEVNLKISPDELGTKIPDYRPDTKVLVHGARRITPVFIGVANTSAISGKSAAQEKLLDRTRSSDVQYEVVPGTKFLKVRHYKRFRYFSLVRWKARGGEASSPESLTQWIVAYCSQSSSNEPYECGVQRIHAGLLYEFHISERNIDHVDSVAALIDEHLDRWKSQCESKA